MGNNASARNLVLSSLRKEDWNAILQRIMTSYNDISKSINPKGLLKINLTSAQIKLLTCFSDKPRFTMTELSKNLDVSMPTMTAMIDRLIKSGLVERERDDTDRRVVRVKLTEGGVGILRRLKKIRREEMEKILMSFNEEEMSSYLTSIEMVSRLLTKARQKRDMERVL